MSKWEKGTLASVCTVIPGYAFKSRDWCSEGLPVLKIKNIRGDGTVDTSDVDYVPSSLMSERLKRFTVKSGDILLAMTGATAGKVGKLRSPLTHLLNQRVAKLVPTKVDPTFFWALVSSAEYQDRFFRLADGAAQPNMSGSQIEAVLIPLPPRGIQCRIGSILGAYDDLIEVNRRRAAVLEEMARRLFEEWFVRFRFPGHDAVPLVGTTDGSLPEGWERRNVGQLGQIITGKTPSKAQPEYFGQDVPFLKIPDLHDTLFVEATSEKLSADGAASQANKTVPAGSICVSCIGTIGLVAITTGPCQTNQQINTIVPVAPEWTEYLYFSLVRSKQHLINLGSNGATMGNVNKHKFSGLNVICPAAALLTAFHSYASPLFDLIRNTEHATRRLSASRDLLLPRLVSGQLSVEAAGRHLEAAA